jgi:hypothetical protein
VRHSAGKFEWTIDRGELSNLVININLSIIIIFKNGTNIINTRSNITFILYYCKTIFIKTIIVSIDILITKNY